MIHNLLPNRDKVYITYDIDFIPDSSPAAKEIHEVKTLWLDVEGGKAYPVFDVHRGSGRDGRFTYPDDQPGAYGGGPARNTQVVPRDGVLVGDGRAPPPRRPLHRPQAHARRAHGQPVPLEGALLGAGRRGVVGRGDDRDDAQVARRTSSAATSSASRPPTTPSARPGTSRWGSTRWRSRPAWAAASTRSRATRQARQDHPRPPAREPQPRRRVQRPPRPAQAARRPGRRRPRSRSPTSSTARATC